MSNRRVPGDESFEFSRPDASAGGEPLSSNTLAADHEMVLVVLLRSHYCPLCREIVQSLRDEYQSFASRSTAVVAVLPEQVERGALWQRRYELPFPILADPGEKDGEEPDFEVFTPYQQYLQELPGAVLFRSTSEELSFVTTFGGEQPGAFPSVETVLDEIEACDEEATPAETGSRADS